MLIEAAKLVVLALALPVQVIASMVSAKTAESIASSIASAMIGLIYATAIYAVLAHVKGSDKAVRAVLAIAWAWMLFAVLILVVL